MSSSENEDVELLPPPPKRRKFVYKNLAERIQEVIRAQLRYEAISRVLTLSQQGLLL